MDIEPYVKNKPNNKIIYNSDNDEFWDDSSQNDIDTFSLSDEFTKFRV